MIKRFIQCTRQALLGVGFYYISEFLKSEVQPPSRAAESFFIHKSSCMFIIKLPKIGNNLKRQKSTKQNQTIEAEKDKQDKK
jgi:hypothetical protein